MYLLYFFSYYTTYYKLPKLNSLQGKIYGTVERIPRMYTGNKSPNGRVRPADANAEAVVPQRLGPVYESLVSIKHEPLLPVFVN